ncbi:MAG: alkaline phosphatase [Rhodocyclaceae bacterium]|nr:MAG: alkaline phosphatase [Rhodocyclaceae bacterium]
MHQLVRKLVAASVAATFAAGAVSPAFADTPVVQGPESVQDWFDNGQKFIADSKRVHAHPHKAKNVILFVGDGMGVSTVTAARILDGQMKGMTGEENRLAFENFPYLALSKTYSWDQQTSDSAPTMTAMVTGYKAREGQLSVNHLTPRGECSTAVIAANSLPTILEQAAAAGKSTGIVSTARITHATPAATYAHTSVRDWEHNGQIASAATCAGVADPVKDIARQMIELSPAVKASLKVALGGGREYFRANTQFDPEYTTKKGLRTDGRDLTAEWVTTRGPNAKFVFDKAGFDAADPATTKHLLGLFERSHMQYEADRNAATTGEPSLTEMTEKSISMLKKNHKGFFLHVEAGRIDHAHHAGNAKRALLDAIELSKAVKKAYEMTDPRDTLILVTADHSHVFTIAGYPHRGNDILGLAAEVPNVDGDSPSPSMAGDGMPYTTLAYTNGPGAVSGTRADLSSVDTTAIGYMQQAVVPMGSETHAGEDVAIYASGPRAHLVRGTMEQNWIYHVMKEAFDF